MSYIEDLSGMRRQVKLMLTKGDTRTNKLLDLLLELTKEIETKGAVQS